MPTIEELVDQAAQQSGLTPRQPTVEDLVDQHAAAAGLKPVASVAGGPYIAPNGKRLANPEVASAFRNLTDAARREGLEVRLNSGDRTSGQQQAIWNGAAPIPGNPNLRRQANGLPVARPGISPHERGLAADMEFYRNGQKVDPRRVLFLAQEHGFHWFGPGDAVHFNYRPKPATLAELHQREETGPPVLPPAGPGTVHPEIEAAVDQAMQQAKAGPHTLAELHQREGNIPAAPTQKFGTRAEEGIAPHGGVARPGLPPIGAYPANRAAETSPRPGELRQESPAEFAQRSQQAAAQPVDPVSAGLRKAAPVTEFIAGGAFPNMHAVLQRGARPGQSQQLADQELAAAFVKDTILNRVAGAVGKAAEGRLILTKLGQRWLAQQALSGPVKAAVMRVLSPARLAGEAAVGATYQGVLDAPENLSPQERAKRLAQGAVGQAALGTVLHAGGEALRLRGEARAGQAADQAALQQYETSARAPQEGHVAPAPERPVARAAGPPAADPAFVPRPAPAAPGPRYTPQVGDTVRYPDLPDLPPLRVTAVRGGKVELAGPAGQRVTTTPERLAPAAEVPRPGAVEPNKAAPAPEAATTPAAPAEPVHHSQLQPRTPEGQFDGPPEGRATGLANQVQAREVSEGTLLRDPEKGVPIGSAEAQQRGAAIASAKSDPVGFAENIAKSIAEQGRPFNAEEVGVLLEGKRRLVNAANEAADAYDEAIRSGSPETPRLRAEWEQAQQRLQAIADNVQKGKTAWHSTGMALQAGTTLEHGNPAEVLVRARRAAGADLTAAQSAPLRELSQRIGDLEKAHADLQQSHQQLKEEHAQLAAEASKPARERNASVEKRRARILKDRAAIHAEIDKILSGGKLHDIGSATYDAARFGYAAGRLALSHIREKGLDLEEAITHVISELKAKGLTVTPHDVKSDIWELSYPKEGKPQSPAQKAERAAISQAVKELGGRPRDAVEPGRTINRQIGREQRASEAQTRKDAAKAQREAERPAKEAAARAERLRKRIAELQAGVAKAPSNRKQPMSDEIRRLLAEHDDLVKQRRDEANALRRQGAEPGRTINRQIRTETQAQAALDAIQHKLKVKDYTALSQRARRDPTLALQEIRGRTALLKRELEGRIEQLRPKTRAEKLKANLADVANLPRTLETTADLSAIGRQGAWLAVSHPVEASRAYAAQLRSFRSETSHEQLAAQIAGRENAQSGLDRRAKLYLSPMTESDFLQRAGLNAREESYVSRSLGRVPGFGKLHEASERAYAAFLNAQRVQRWDHLVSIMRMQGFDPQEPKDLPMFQRTAAYLNAATGRGGLGNIGQAADYLGQAFFSPRYQSSLIYRLNPVKYASLPRGVRLQATLDGLKYFAFVATILGVAKAAGQKVETDPRSSDFGKIVHGQAHYDPGIGFLPWLRYAATVLTRTRKDARGRLAPADFTDTTGRFIRGKTAPIPGFLWDVAQGKDVVGNPVRTPGQIASDAGEHFIPMAGRDIYDVLSQHSDLANIILGPLASIHGVGVQTYDPNHRRAPAPRRR